MADVHVTFQVAVGVTAAETLPSDQTVTLSGGGTKLASALAIGDTLADGRQVTQVHAPTDVAPPAGVRNVVQAGFRGRNDNGTETTATWKAAENTNWSQTVDEQFRVRFVVDEIGGVQADSVFCQLQCNRNSAGWNDVHLFSAVVRSVVSPNVADNTRTTRQLTSGTGTFQQGEIDTSNGQCAMPPDVTGRGLAAGNLTEFEYCVKVDGTQVANNDTIQLRLHWGAGSPLTAGLLDGYLQTPTITVVKAG